MNPVTDCFHCNQQQVVKLGRSKCRDVVLGWKDWSINGQQQRVEKQKENTPRHKATAYL